MTFTNEIKAWLACINLKVSAKKIKILDEILLEKLEINNGKSKCKKQK